MLDQFLYMHIIDRIRVIHIVYRSQIIVDLGSYQRWWFYWVKDNTFPRNIILHETTTVEPYITFDLSHCHTPAPIHAPLTAHFLSQNLFFTFCTFYILHSITLLPIYRQIGRCSFVWNVISLPTYSDFSIIFRFLFLFAEFYWLYRNFLKRK